jgi:hypothetical protein
MNVIGHQAIAHQGHLASLNIFAQQVQIYLSVGVACQQEPPRVPTLRYMVRNICGNHPRQACHKTALSRYFFPSLPFCRYILLAG